MEQEEAMNDTRYHLRILVTVAVPLIGLVALLCFYLWGCDNKEPELIIHTQNETLNSEAVKDLDFKFPSKVTFYVGAKISEITITQEDVQRMTKEEARDVLLLVSGFRSGLVGIVADEFILKMLPRWIVEREVEK